MSIKVAQAVIRNGDEGNKEQALKEICGAIKKGYLLCKVNYVLEKLKANTSDSERDYYLGVNYGLMLAAKFIKEGIE